MPVSFLTSSYLTASPSFYLVHHAAFLAASLLHTRSHTLKDCMSRRVLSKSETMIETTPLLPQASRPCPDLSIFPRVCHSPWPFLGQKTLLAIRAIFASFLSIVLALEIKCTRRGEQLAFEASIVSLVIQIFYYWTTSVGVLSLRCINLLTLPTVLDPATHIGALRSISSR